MKEREREKETVRGCSDVFVASVHAHVSSWEMKTHE